MVLELEYDRSLYGKEHRAGPFEVTNEMIQAFTRSIGESDPLFVDETAAREAGYRGLVAPPTFCTVLVAQLALPDINLKFGRMQSHAGERVQPRAPIVVGDQLTASSRLKDVYAKTGRSGTMVFVAWETTFRNQNGEVVADIVQSFARRE
jgi:acyl dehydratase